MLYCRLAVSTSHILSRLIDLDLIVSIRTVKVYLVVILANQEGLSESDLGVGHKSGNLRTICTRQRGGGPVRTECCHVFAG